MSKPQHHGRVTAAPPRMEKVSVFYLHGAQEYSAFSSSLLDLVIQDAAKSHRLSAVSDIKSNVNVSGPRNMAVQGFLDSKADWMLMLDNDMTFGSDLVDRLMSVADKDERPIVSGLYFGIDAQPGRKLKITPHLYGLLPDGRGLYRAHDYARDSLVKVAGAGTGCLLVHRRVFEAIKADERFEPPWYWFAEQPICERDEAGKAIPETAVVYSEDLTFSIRAQMCGFPIFVHTGIKCGHVKEIVIDEDMYLSSVESTNAAPIMPPVAA